MRAVRVRPLRAFVARCPGRYPLAAPLERAGVRPAQPRSSVRIEAEPIARVVAADTTLPPWLLDEIAALPDDCVAWPPDQVRALARRALSDGAGRPHPAGQARMCIIAFPAPSRYPHRRGVTDPRTRVADR